MKKIKRLLILCLTLLVPILACTETLSGRVVAVADGDTVTVLDASNAQHIIRVMGIDAPEKRQPFGERSKQNMAHLVFDKEVQVEWVKKDRYGRILGKVFVAEEDCVLEPCSKTVDTGLAQIASGFAWYYKQYEREQTVEDRNIYAQTEIEAQTNKIGVWSDPNPMPPWVFRHGK
jgi:endonuclease YncB( thermonuclease family)